jgi:hypothetical protein
LLHHIVQYQIEAVVVLVSVHQSQKGVLRMNLHLQSVYVDQVLVFFALYVYHLAFFGHFELWASAFVSFWASVGWLLVVALQLDLQLFDLGVRVILDCWIVLVLVDYLLKDCCRHLQLAPLILVSH